MLLQCTLCMLITSLCAVAANAYEGDGRVLCHGYSDCIKLENKTTTVVVSGACGGRILEYSLNGLNALYLNPKQDGWTYSPGKPNIDPTGGRMDIGPETTAPAHPDLWLGRWATERTGALSARMTSVADQASGVQLVRDFELAKDSSKLQVTQTILNISSKPVKWFHWSRTLAPSGGICIVPLTPGSRFPGKYATWEPDWRINVRPQDANVKVQDDVIFVTGYPVNAKLGFDSFAGKLAYLTRNNLLFVKTFPVFPDENYGELVPITVSVCYAKGFCELEPIGPQRSIAPNYSESFTETWSLSQYIFPEDVGDPSILRRIFQDVWLSTKRMSQLSKE